MTGDDRARSTGALPFSEGALYPAEVSYYSMRFDVERERNVERPFDIVIPDALRSAVPKRRVEFAAGRRCAREALRSLEPTLEHAKIGIGAQREPLFPPGVCGTISHAEGIASAAVAWSSAVLGIGLDIEAWIADDVAVSIGENILVTGESERLQQATGWSMSRALTLAFSAKESLYKCLFPTVQQYFDFQDAELASIDVATGRFWARLRVPLPGGLRSGDTFEGRFAIGERLIVTAIVRRPGSTS